MYDWPILSLIIFLPLAGAAMVMLINDKSEFGLNNIRAVALFSTSFTFAVSLLLWFGFDKQNPDFQFVEKHDWLAGASYNVGLDGMSLLLLLTTTFIMPICVLASWKSILEKAKSYVIAILVLETLILGALSALDIVFFFVFLEASIVPILLLLGIWGQQDRVAATKYFLFALSGSVFMFIAIWAIYWSAGGSSDIVELTGFPFAPQIQTWFWLAFFVSFAVKIPIWPLHTWMLDVVSKAPLAVGVVVLALLTKLGAYGFLRFSTPIFPHAAEQLAPIGLTLITIGFFWSCLACFAQQDLRKFLCHLSIAQLCFAMIGVFAVSTENFQIQTQASVLLLVAHSLVFAGLLLCADVLSNRTDITNINALGGLANRMPRFAVIFIIFAFSALGIPFTLAFMAKFLLFITLAQGSIILLLIAGLGTLLYIGACATLIRRLFFGPLANEGLKKVQDIGKRESFSLLLVVVLLVGLGLFPNSLLKVSESTFERMAEQFSAALTTQGDDQAAQDHTGS